MVNLEELGKALSHYLVLKVEVVELPPSQDLPPMSVQIGLKFPRTVITVKDKEGNVKFLSQMSVPVSREIFHDAGWDHTETVMKLFLAAIIQEKGFHSLIDHKALSRELERMGQ